MMTCNAARHGYWVRRFAAIIAVVLLTLVPGCMINPATGQRQFNVIGHQQEIALGERSAPQFLEAYGGPVPSQPVRDYVSDLGRRLAAQSERANLPWQFNVVDSKTVNAFALPGGKVFISRGLLAKLGNEAQLAGVLGHEIAHVTAQHINQQMTRALGLQMVGIVLAVAGEHNEDDWLKALGVGTTVGGTLYMLRFSRDNENQADSLGLRYMTRLGYNPAAHLQVLKMLRDEADGPSPQWAEFMSTHPLPATRLKRIEAVIRKQYPDYEDLEKYKFNIEPFKHEVLDRLDALPQPRHDPEKKTPARQTARPTQTTTAHN